LSAVTARPLFQYVRHYIDSEERRAVLAEIAAHQQSLRRVDGRAGIGPRYAVLGGDVIASSLPRVAALGVRVRTLVEAFAGSRLEPFHDTVRRARVQMYTGREDGFRWHFDGHEYAALVTLENDSEGVTELIAPSVSSVVRPLFYPAYAMPAIFSVLPRTSVTTDAGDALIFNGRRSLHRGRSRDGGRRTILVFAFDPAGRKVSRLRTWIARKVNY
jgi:hypothetical protein